MAHKTAKQLGLPSGDVILGNDNIIRMEPKGSVERAERTVGPAAIPTIRPNTNYEPPKSSQNVSTSHMDKARGFVLVIAPFAVTFTIFFMALFKWYFESGWWDDITVIVGTGAFAFTWMAGLGIYMFVSTEGPIILYELLEYRLQRHAQREQERHNKSIYDL